MSQKLARGYSFESLFSRYVWLTTALLLSLLLGIFYLTSASMLVVFTSLLVMFIPYVLLSLHVKNAIQTPLYGLSASLESIRNEDYSLRMQPKFTQGAIKTLSDEVNLMANDLRIRKLHYDQHAVLVLNLIKQLSSPIAVFDQDGRLKHANDAFSNWCGTPWQQMKHAHAKSLGLNFSVSTDANNVTESDLPEGKWQIASSDLARHWQLRYSQLAMQDESYQLLVLTNIEQLVHQTEQVAWHKMTRVLSHEINNSLSPIKSLAQSLEDIFIKQQLDKSAQQALGVIVSRSDGLMQFVNRYASLAQQFEVKIEQVDLVSLFGKVTALFDHPIKLSIQAKSCLADIVLIEQTMINLVKNAVEASSEDSEIEIITVNKQKQVVIQVVDGGAGIANPDNLFVPFYTTKKSGKGIGLALCRNMVEQQNGKLTLQNRQDQKGAVASVVLPISR